MKERNFKLTDKAKEYAPKFGGNTLVVREPESVEDVNRFRKEGLSDDAFLVRLANNQSIALEQQKNAKAVLGHKDNADKPVEEVLKLAQAAIDETVLGEWTPRGEGTGKEKVSEIRARVEAERKEKETLRQGTLDMFKAMTPAVQKQMRAHLIAQGFTEAELDA